MFDTFYIIINRDTVSALIEFGLNEIVKFNIVLQQQNEAKRINNRAERRNSIAPSKPQGNHDNDKIYH